MTQKKSSKEQEVVEVKDEAEVEAPEVVVEVENEVNSDALKQEPPKEEVDVEALRKQISDLEAAQARARQQAFEAQRAAEETAQQLNTFRQSAEQSQYDSIVTAMGAAQIEVDSAKRDIMLAGAAQDYGALADAQERLATAKAHMVGLEQGKNNYEYRKNNHEYQQRPADPIEAMDLSYEEKSWLRQHPEALNDIRKNTKLNAAYFDAMDKGLRRGSPEYFEFIETEMGYRQPPKEPQQHQQEEDNPVMVAAPPSKSVPSGSGTGGTKGRYTLTKEEAEIAKLSGITPQEYVKQREIFRGNKKAHPDDYPER